MSPQIKCNQPDLHSRGQSLKWAGGSGMTEARAAVVKICGSEQSSVRVLCSEQSREVSFPLEPSEGSDPKASLVLAL